MDRPVRSSQHCKTDSTPCQNVWEDRIQLHRRVLSTARQPVSHSNRSDSLLLLQAKHHSSWLWHTACDWVHAFIWASLCLPRSCWGRGDPSPACGTHQLRTDSPNTPSKLACHSVLPLCQRLPHVPRSHKSEPRVPTRSTVLAFLGCNQMFSALEIPRAHDIQPSMSAPPKHSPDAE